VIPRWLLWVAAAILALGVCGLTGSSWLFFVRVDQLMAGAWRSEHEFFGTSR